MAIVPSEFRSSLTIDDGPGRNQLANTIAIVRRTEPAVGFTDGCGDVRCPPCNERIAGRLPHALRAEDISASGERCIHCGQPL